jgi:hypothetical protein
MSDEILVVDDDRRCRRWTAHGHEAVMGDPPTRRHVPDIGVLERRVRAQPGRLSNGAGSAYYFFPNWCIYNIAAALGATPRWCARSEKRGLWRSTTAPRPPRRGASAGGLEASTDPYWSRREPNGRGLAAAASRVEVSSRVRTGTAPSHGATQLDRRASRAMPHASKGAWRHRGRSPPVPSVRPSVPRTPSAGARTGLHPGPKTRSGA